MISVVIPTYDRTDKLKKTLQTIESQTLDKSKFEVIVVNDEKQEGPGQARNKGAERANGSVIFFCGDDTLLDKNLLKIHYEHHQKHKNTALLGIALWDNPNDFMKYITGIQFNYRTIKDYNNAGFDHFYTCNISLEKKWFDLERFDPRFIHAAFEDIDLGLRLEKRGLRIVYEPRAKVLHSHNYQPEAFYKRMFKVGQSLVILLDKYKDDKKSYCLLKWKYAPFLKMTKLFNLISYLLSRILKNKYHWYWSICYHYSRGILIK